MMRSYHKNVRENNIVPYLCRSRRVWPTFVINMGSLKMSCRHSTRRYLMKDQFFSTVRQIFHSILEHIYKSRHDILTERLNLCLGAWCYRTRFCQRFPTWCRKPSSNFSRPTVPTCRRCIVRSRWTVLIWEVDQSTLNTIQQCPRSYFLRCSNSSDK
jgi:hypothetical protein